MSCSSGPDITTNGLILRLDAFDIKSYPKSGTTWFDRSGNGNHGTLTNGPTFSNENGGSIVFDGTNDYASFPALNLNELTICAWVKFDNTTNTLYPTIVNKELSNTSRNFWLGLSPKFTFGRSVSGSDKGLSSNVTPNLNQWYYVTATNTLTPVFSIYINGVLNNTANFSGTLSIAGTATWIGSYRDLFYPIDGNIGQVSIYNRVLSPQEIKQNFNSTKGRYRI